MKYSEFDEETYLRMYECEQNFRYLEQTVLIPNGFIKLLDEHSEYIAFQPEYNIVFYSYDIYNYSYERYCFFQPFMCENHDIRTYKNLGACSKIKTEFPLFNTNEYLNITSILKGFENYGYEASMKRIAQYPLLMEAIGESNRIKIYNLINPNVDTISLENRKNIVCKSKTKTLLRK